MYYLYKITNLVNDKIYFGKAHNIKHRWNGHKNAAKRKTPGDYFYIHKAMNKYGFDNFKIEIIEEFEIEKEALNAEIAAIAKYNTKDRSIGYNLTDGGDGGSGYKFTDEQRANLSRAKKGKYTGSENPFWGKKHTEEFKAGHAVTMKSIYENNVKKYDSLNSAQCSLNLAKCLEIQVKYLTKKYSFENLAEEYSIGLKLIHKILHGHYAVIKNCSLIREDQFQKIKKEHYIVQGNKNRKFTELEELDIVDNYHLGSFTIGSLAIKYNCSNPTIKNIFVKYDIKIIKGPKIKSSKRFSIQEVEILKHQRLILKMTYNELSKLHNGAGKKVLRAAIYDKEAYSKK